MDNSASRFISNRYNRYSLTTQRVQIILWYIIECYKIFQEENVKYSKKFVKENTTINFEDYLKFEFIDSYLTLNKNLLKDKLSDLENINFHAEVQERYIDSIDGKQKPDKIDIYINKIGLANEWKDIEENVYFAIECKRIKKLSDSKLYLQDIEKFSNRNYSNLRLPFEGQMAFIESPKLAHKSVSDDINKKLHSSSSIKTEKYLTPTLFHNSFDGSYISKHIKNYDKSLFTIFHLMLDYSSIVVE